MVVLITNKARQDFYYDSVLNFVIKWLSISVRKRNEEPRYLPAFFEMSQGIARILLNDLELS